MPSCPVVTPEQIRLSLVDPYTRAHETLLSRTEPTKATADEVSASLDAIAEAESRADWVEVKKKLNAGEYRDLLSAQFKDAPAGGLQINYHNIGASKIKAYLLAWSFVTTDGKPLPIEAIDSISPEAYRDVLAVIDAHHDANELAAEAKKKTPVGASTSAAISASVG